MKNKYKYPLTYGVSIAVALIAYFLLLSLFDAHVNPAYSIFNLVILGVGLYLAVTNYKKEKGLKFKFNRGFMVGLASGWSATIIFTAFFALYTELDPSFLEELITMWETDWYTNVGMVIVTVGLMGFASTVPITYAWVQLHKNTRNTSEGKKHTY